MDIFKRLFMLMFMMMFITSCHESFNKIYEDIEEQDPNVVPPEEVDMKKVNILPTLSDPLYMIDNTRAWSGPFESFENDREHWLNTRFHVFGLMTSNCVGGNADYVEAKNGNKQYGVLWNQMMGISDQQGHTVFYDQENNPVTCKYNPDDNMYRYKFFMLGTDGLDADLRVEDGNKIIARMELDGTNDIMQSFAYHSDKQYQEEVAQLPNDETTKLFLEGGVDYMYNRLSGNRGFHPIFNVNHLLSRFDIYVKGANPYGDNSCDFLKVFITDVSIKAAKSVDVVVADDSWERDTYKSQFESNQLLSLVGEPVKHNLSVKCNKFGNNEFTKANRGDIDFDFLAKESADLSAYIGKEIIPANSHWVCNTERDSLCETILIPPLPTDTGNFVLSYKYRYVYMHYDQDSGKYHLGRNEGNFSDENLWEEYQERNVVIPNVDIDGEQVNYMGGRRYSILLTVYGQSIVVVDVLKPTMWIEGGDINADEDN